MITAIVTVKFRPVKNHDPKKKVVGKCAWSNTCTDSTGGHHSVLVEAESIAKIEEDFMSYHITRIEVIDK